MLPISIELPKSFFDEETRCGYSVSSKIKRVWAVQLDLFSKISSVCAKHHISFQVYYGTLLGAVRHKGFIPWDDDFDICMDRENFERFCALPQSEFGAPYFLQTPLTDRKFFTPIVRVRNSQTTAAIKGLSDLDYNNGIYIDVYPMDGMPRGKIREMVQTLMLHLVLQPLQSYYMQQFPGGVKGVVLRISKMIFKFVSFERLYKCYVSIASMYSKSSDRVGLTTFFKANDRRSWAYKSEFGDLCLLDFEHIQVPVSTAYDKILTRSYGKYMEFPPENQRGLWHDGQLELDPDTPYRQFLKK